MSMNESIITVIPGVEYLTYEQMNILISFQKLWSQLAIWMRNYIFGNFENSDNLQAVMTRLFQSLPYEFYDSLRIFYGAEISQIFLNNISNFLTSAYQLINAYKMSDTSAIDASAAKWYQSADDLATFLATINIYWSKDQWSNLLYQYIQYIIAEVIAIKGGDYENEISIFSDIDDLTDLMGSYMARGIIARNIGIK